MVRYIGELDLQSALRALPGTAGEFFHYWLALKQMGLKPGVTVMVDTKNGEEPLRRLFDFGSPEGSFYIPFAATPRFQILKDHISRSGLQTNVKQWLDDSGTMHPGSILKVTRGEDGSGLYVKTQRNYPVGLGTGRDGFASRDGQKVSLPELAWAIWYGRQTEIPDGVDAPGYLRSEMRRELNLSSSEAANVFSTESSPVELILSEYPLTDEDIYRICSDNRLNNKAEIEQVSDTIEQNQKRVKMNQTVAEGPEWLGKDPQNQIEELLDQGHKAIILYGPPRTGKTRAVQQTLAGTHIERIQIHDGWGYNELVVGQSLKNSEFVWERGALVRAIQGGVKAVVLEEANRTNVSQALGEVFSLVEPAYRGEGNAITLPNGEKFFIPEGTAIILTLNNLDKSTEDVDDALYGRFRSIYFPPRVEDLRNILDANGISVQMADKICEFFVGVQKYYPLGHGYFAEFRSNADPALYYMTAIRPVLANRFGAMRQADLSAIDNLFDETVLG
ncbi:AAA family ATPase [Kocuria flava]|uniref:AAA family ATPase n=1 Tax=Kocuria flava TaxID=446860 RepID=UPI001FF202C2|nr:AAA family ATPase [Kocuria flava]MCJ8506091.1 AAA family ATPase [Kocuria flava]